MRKLILGLFGVLLFTSCTSTKQAGNLSYADVSLNFSSEEFEVISLEPVSASAKSFFGISENVNESSILDRSEFNTESGATWGLLTMAAAVPSAIVTGVLAGETYDDDTYEYYNDPVTTFLVSAIGISVAGIINDVSWTNSTRAKAIQKCNWMLKQNNPNIDSFINPKYDVKYKKGVFGTECTVTVHAQGIVLKNKK